MGISTPSMNFNKNKVLHTPIKTFQVNDSIIMAIYPGSLSPLDILIKYRQKLSSGKWSAIRTPKHIHWTVDILMKMQTYKELTQQFLDYFIDVWNKTEPLKSEDERQSLDCKSILDFSEVELDKIKELSTKGEYSVKFLILLAKLLMIQEKTNRADAYMFNNVLQGLRKGNDLFSILSSATLRSRG